MQRMGFVPILCVSVIVIIDTMSKLDPNVDFDAKCEQTFISVLTVFRLLLFVSKLPNFCRFSAVSKIK